MSATTRATDSIAAQHAYEAPNADRQREPSSTPSRRRVPNGWQRIRLGALGSLAPFLVNAAVADPVTVFSAITATAMLGYGFRVVGLMTLGALVAWAHGKETNSLRLFEVGIIAPALVTTMMNAAAARDSTVSAAKAQQVTAALFIPRAAYAQSSYSSGRDTVYAFDAPPESRLEQFWRGFTGVTPRDRWFVVLDVAPMNRGEAREAKRNLSARGFKARLYGAGGPRTGEVTVVIGDWLSEKEAEELLARAQRRSIPAMVWYLPRRGGVRSAATP